MSSDNTQLPDLVITEIYQLVKDKTEIEREYWNNTPSADPDRAKTYVAGYAKGVKAGATEYAIKLHQAEQDLNKAKLLLAEIKKVYDKGLPTWDIIKEIKTFLDGTK